MDIYPVTLTLPDGTTRTKCRLIRHADGPATFYWWDPAVSDGVAVYETTDELVEIGRTSASRAIWALGDARAEQTCPTCGRHPLRRWRPPEGNVAVAEPKVRP